MEFEYYDAYALSHYHRSASPLESNPDPERTSCMDSNMLYYCYEYVAGKWTTEVKENSVVCLDRISIEKVLRIFLLQSVRRTTRGH